MSLNVSLYNEVDVGEYDCVFDGSITHNLNKMADMAGCYMVMWRPEGLGVKKASDIEPQLRQSLKLLRSEPEFFSEFNPENRWGSYDTLVNFLDRYHKACKRYPEAIIEVSR